MKIGYLILFALLTLSYTLTAQEKPYSLEKDKKAAQQLKEKNKISIDDERMNELINILNSSKKENEKLKTIDILSKAYDNKKQIPVLEKLLLKDSSDNVRAECAKSLRCLESVDSKPILIRALNDNNTEVKLQAALSLAYLGEKKLSLKTLEEIYNEDNRRNMLACIKGYRYINSDNSLKKISLATNNNDPFVAAYAAVVLAQLGFYNDSFSVLKNLVNNKNKYVRLSALTGLAYIGDNKSLKLIERILHDDSEEIIKNRCKLILNKYNYEK